MMVPSVTRLAPGGEPMPSHPAGGGSPSITDDPFGRTLTELLTADRPEQPKSAERSRSGQRDANRSDDDNPAERSEGRRVDRSDDDTTDRDTGRADDVDDVNDDRRSGDGPTRSRSDDRPAGTDDPPPGEEGRPDVTGTERAAERIGEQLVGAGETPPDGLVTALTNLTGEMSGEPAADMTTAEVESVPIDEQTPDPVAETETTDPRSGTDTDSNTDTIPVASEPETALVGDDGPSEPTDRPTDGVDRARPTPPADRTPPGGQAVAELARDHRGAGLADVVSEMIETTDGDRVAGPSANASPVAILATGRNETGADEAPGDTETAPADTPPPIPAEDTTQGTMHGSTDDTTADASVASEADVAVTGDDTAADMADAPGLERVPTNPAAARPAPASPSTPRPPAATPTQGSTVPADLVELGTAGLAERLRPAFAAVRRGLNGIDELRLRIRDDNAGPIKVDIATIDNRVRVLLSAGNDDLMRQLGQERDRLADELRRAGFDQASIDIASGEGGERPNGYETEPGQAGTGRRAGEEPAGPGLAGRHTAGLARQRTRTDAGLDLDL